MSHFLYKLISSRSTFPQDMTRGEIKVMQKHLTYWKELTERSSLGLLLIQIEYLVWRLLKLMMKQLSMALA